MPILEYVENLGNPRAGCEPRLRGDAQVSKQDIEAVKADLQGLVSDRVEVDVALEETIQAHLLVVVDD